MARVGIVFGWLLCGLTLFGLVSSPEKYPTQFIPMMLGIPTLFCGVVALNPHRRRAAMQVAAVVALLGATAGLFRITFYLLELGRGAEVHVDALEIVAAMTLLCALLVGICVKSFRDQRNRKSGRSEAPRATINLQEATDNERGGESRRGKSREKSA